MINNDEGTIEVKTTQTSTPTGRLSNDEGNSARSGSSSDGSSLSDLKKRLQDLPSPDETTRLANRIAALTRRISRKREAYIHLQGLTSRIEEEEKEEKEEAEQTFDKESSCKEFELKDPRARRRAKIYSGTLEVEEESMILSQTSANVDSKMKEESKDEEQLCKNINKSEYLQVNSARPRLSTNETPTDCFQGFKTLSSRTSSNLNLRCNSNLSSNENPLKLDQSAVGFHGNFSPPFRRLSNDGVGAQPIFPLTLSNTRPMKFGGYRPTPGILPKNLSSGTESGWNNEPTHARVTSPPTITKTANISPIASINNNPRESTDRFLSDLHSNETYKNNISSIDSNKFDNTIPKTPDKSIIQNSNNDIMSPPYWTRMSPEKEGTQVHRQSKSAMFSRHNNQLPILTSRSDICDKKLIYSSSYSPKRFGSPSFYVQQDSKNVLKSSSSKSRAMNDDSEPPNKKCLLQDDSENQPSRQVIKENNFNYVTETSDKEYDKTSSILTSARTAGFASDRSPQFITLNTENHSELSTPKTNYHEFLDNGQLDVNNVTYVPKLALNSEEMTSSNSPSNKTFSKETILDTNALITALSNVSLKRGENNVDEAAELNYGEYSDDSKTCLKMESNENFIQADNYLLLPKSPNSEKYGIKIEALKINHKSSFTTRSRIPVRVSSARKFNDSENSMFDHSRNSCQFGGIGTPSNYESVLNSAKDSDCSQNSKGNISPEKNLNELFSPKSKIQEGEDDNIEKLVSSISIHKIHDEETDNIGTPNSFCRRKDSQVELKDHHENTSQEISPDLNKITSKSLNYHPSKLRLSVEKLAAEQIRKNVCTGRTKVVQSEVTVFLEQETHEAPLPSRYSSSATKLYSFTTNKEKSPFTISEKTSAISMNCRTMSDDGQCANFDDDSKSLEGTYKLDMHPSITRLAGSGFEETPESIIKCVTNNNREEKHKRLPGIMGIVQRISSKFSKTKKRNKDEKSNPRSTNIIYENRAYQGDSIANTCSGTSIIEIKRPDNVCDNRCIDNSPDEKSCSFSSEKTIQRKSCENVLSRPEQPRRRYDRDDLWVTDLKDRRCRRKRSNVSKSKTSIEASRSLSRDPHSLFFVRTISPKFESNEYPSCSRKEQRSGSSKTRSNTQIRLVDGPLPLITKKSAEDCRRDEDVETIFQEHNLEEERKHKNTEPGCFCLTFCQLITKFFAPRSSPNYQPPIKKNPRRKIKRESRFPLQKRKAR